MSPALSEAQREAAEELIEQTTQEAMEQRVTDLTAKTLNELDDRGYDTSREDVKKAAAQAAIDILFGSDTPAETVEIAVGGRQNSSTEVALDADTPRPKMITDEVEIPTGGQEDGKCTETVEVERVDPRSMRSNMEFQEKFEEEYSVPRANRGPKEQSSDPEDVPVAGRRLDEYDYVDKQSMPDPAMENKADSDRSDDDTDGDLPWFQ